MSKNWGALCGERRHCLLAIEQENELDSVQENFGIAKQEIRLCFVVESYRLP